MDLRTKRTRTADLMAGKTLMALGSLCNRKAEEGTTGGMWDDHVVPDPRERETEHTPLAIVEVGYTADGDDRDVALRLYGRGAAALRRRLVRQLEADNRFSQIMATGGGVTALYRAS